MKKDLRAVQVCISREMAGLLKLPGTPITKLTKLFEGFPSLSRCGEVAVDF